MLVNQIINLKNILDIVYDYLKDIKNIEMKIDINENSLKLYLYEENTEKEIGDELCFKLNNHLIQKGLDSVYFNKYIDIYL